MMGTKPSSATCATFWGSVTPSNRRTATYIALAHLLHIEGGTGRPRLKLINVPSVKGCKASRNFGELRKSEVQPRRIPIPRTRVNTARTRRAQRTDVPHDLEEAKIRGQKGVYVT